MKSYKSIAYVFNLYRLGHPNVKSQLLFMKNPQFWPNLPQTFRNCPHHGWVNPRKFEQDWSKIMDFSLIASKVAISH